VIRRPTIAAKFSCLLLFSFLFLLAACNTSSVDRVTNSTTLTVGTWGSDSAGVLASDTVTHVHIGCTYGDIPGRLRLDANGQFNQTGSFLLRAYPVAIGPTMPAQFSGRVSDGGLTITVTVTDTIARSTVVRGPVTIRFGVTPRLTNCPICHTPGDRAKLLANQ
jgi:hypothetical protein